MATTPQSPQPVQPQGEHIPWYREWFKAFFLVLLIAIVIGFGVAVRYFYTAYQKIETAAVDLSSFSTENNQSKLSDADTQKVKNISNVDVENYSDDPSIGPTNAVLTVVAFEDFECPFCGETFRPLKTVMAKYKDRVHFVYRDFPVTDLHPNAENAAEAANCVNEQGKFWQYHDMLFTNQKALSVNDLRAYAQQLGINMGAYDNCVQSHKYAKEVEKDFNDGLNAGVEGTPTIFFNGNPVSGALNEEQFEQIIQVFLSQQAGT